MFHTFQFLRRREERKTLFFFEIHVRNERVDKAFFYWAEDDGTEEISIDVFSSGPDINTATTEEEDGENEDSNGCGIRSEVAGSALALCLPPLIQSIGGGARVLLLSMMIW